MKKKYVKHLLKCLYNFKYRLVRSWFYIPFRFNCKVFEAGENVITIILFLFFLLSHKFFDVSCTTVRLTKFLLSPLIYAGLSLLNKKRLFKESVQKSLDHTVLLFTQLCRYPSGLKPVIIHVKKYKKLGFY